MNSSGSITPFLIVWVTPPPAKKAPKNSKIAILLGSANRDESAFVNPEQINFERKNLNHKRLFRLQLHSYTWIFLVVVVCVSRQ